jgi:hypothetical protein
MWTWCTCTYKLHVTDFLVFLKQYWWATIINWSSILGVGPQELQWNGAAGKAVTDARNTHPPLTGDTAQMLIIYHIGLTTLKSWAIGAMR